MKGHTGKILHVDLTRGAWREETLPGEVYEQHLAGIGLAAHVLNRCIPGDADPLGPENVLGFVAGTLTGTGALFAGRWMAAAKSPLTDGWGDANCGGNFGPAIKRCGYDGIFVSGAAAEPVYLFVDGKSVAIRPAAGLWGADAVETEAQLRAACGERASVACIGPAGEKLSLISGIVNEHGRLAARSGLGAVMGSKKLKAVVLAGSQRVPVAHPEAMGRLGKAVVAFMPKDSAGIPGWLTPALAWIMGRSPRMFRIDGLMGVGEYPRYGTTMANVMSSLSGDAPVRNWRGHPGQFDARRVSKDRILSSVARKYRCQACPLGCGAINRLDGPYPETHRPEYETCTAFGALLLNEDLDSIFQINEALNRAGMDTISAGAAVAFAIDCFEAGLLTEADTGGLVLRWGDSKAIAGLVRQMIAREGLGDVLADGVRRAAERIGRGAERFAFHAQGQEIPMHDPRHDPGLGVSYVADPTPGRHTIGSNANYETFRLWTRVSWAPAVPQTYNVRSYYYEPGAEYGVRMAACGMYKVVLDGAGQCLIGAILGADRCATFEYLNAATGWQKTPDEYMAIGRRVQTLRQQFNLRQGLEPAEVSLNPVLTGDPPATRGPNKGRHYDLPALRRAYWEAMGWDPLTGRPREGAPESAR